MSRILVISVALAVCRVAVGGGFVAPGERVPNLSDIRWIRGDPVDRFETGRVYVLEFWSTWCGACVDSIDGLNDLARRYEKNTRFISIHIWPQESAPKPVEFLEQRLREDKAIMDFPVAEDSNGETAKAWMDATESTGLPTAMIVDRTSRLVWVGHARDLEKPLKEVVEGAFDFSRGLAEMKLRIRVGRLANESAKTIERGEYDEGIRLILEALDADPNTVSDWIPSTYGHLLASSRSAKVAAGFVSSVLATDAGKGRDLLAGLANVIVHFRPKELRDLELALTLARKADAMSNGRDARILSMMAMIRAELGDVPGAIKELESAIRNAPNEEGREVLSKTLKDLREPTGK